MHGHARICKKPVSCRSIYTLADNVCHTERLYGRCKELIKFLKASGCISHYNFHAIDRTAGLEVKKKTDEVYGNYGKIPIR